MQYANETFQWCEIASGSGKITVDFPISYTTKVLSLMICNSVAGEGGSGAEIIKDSLISFIKRTEYGNASFSWSIGY